MKQMAFALLAWALLGAQESFAQPRSQASDAPSVESRSFAAARIEADTRFLADDLLEGREVGTRGFALAALYVSQAFRAGGLAPTAQTISFVRAVTEPDTQVQVGSVALRQGQEVALDINPGMPALDVRAPLVFAGYGHDRPDLGFEDYGDIDVHGKIVVLVDGFPDSMDTELGAHLYGQKARIAAGRGAVGVLFIRSRADEEHRAWTKLAGNASDPRISWREPDGSYALEQSRLLFMGFASRHAAETLFAKSPVPLDAILDVVARPDGRPAAVDLQATARVAGSVMTEEMPSSNILAMVPAADRARGAAPIVVTAHLDGLGFGGKDPADRIRNGALDNAVGVAVMLEAARAIALGPARRPVVFVATTAEEKGLLGATYLIAHWPYGETPAANVNIDMPLLDHPFSEIIAYGARHSSLEQDVKASARAQRIGYVADPHPAWVMFIRSDQYPFAAAGIPAIYLAPGFGAEGTDRFERFIDTRYHKPNDDLSQSIDWHAAAQFALYLEDLVRRVAAEPRPPTYLDSVFAPKEHQPR